MPEQSESPAGPKQRAEDLISLLTRECGTLTQPEKKLARAVVFGEECDLLRPGDEPLTTASEPDAWKAWEEHRHVRAVFLRTLCVSEDARSLIDPRGIRLLNAAIEGQLDLDGADVRIDLMFGWCVFEQAILARGSRVGTLNLQGTHVAGFEGDRLVVNGGLFLRLGFRSHGLVRLSGADIAGYFDCTAGHFSNDGDDSALEAQRIRVKDDVLFVDGFEADGAVTVSDANIAGNFCCNWGSFGAGDDALLADGMRISGTLYLVHSTFRGLLDLSGVRAGTLFDDEDWPELVILDDFRYDAISASSPSGATIRLQWLRNHDSASIEYLLEYHPHNPGPYRWLAAILRKQGFERDADKVMTSLGWRRVLPFFKHRTDGSAWEKFVAVPYLVASLLYGTIVGHGYARFRPLLWLAGFWLAGSVIFAFPSGQTMQPSQTLALRTWSPAAPTDANNRDWLGDYPTFSPVVYSIDAFLPLVDFHQEEYWTPRNGPGVWRWLVKNVYLPFHIISGWIIATLFAASFTRLARQD